MDFGHEEIRIKTAWDSGRAVDLLEWLCFKRKNPQEHEVARWILWDG